MIVVDEPHQIVERRDRASFVEGEPVAVGENAPCRADVVPATQHRTSRSREPLGCGGLLAVQQFRSRLPDDDGNVDVERVREDAKLLVTERPGLRKLNLPTRRRQRRIVR